MEKKKKKKNKHFFTVKNFFYFHRCIFEVVYSIWELMFIFVIQLCLDKK